VPAAAAYIKFYDDVIETQAAQRREMEKGRESLVELDRAVRSCLAIAHNAVSGSDGGNFAGGIQSPEQLISDGFKVLKLLSQLESGAQGEPLKAQLEAALQAAQKQWGEAQAARMTLQQYQAELREHAKVLNRELVALRRVLRAVVGTSHLAFQTLRVSRVQPEALDEDDTVVVEEGVDPFAQTGEHAPLTNGAAARNATASLPVGQVM
jgi:hypothetical protein